MACSPETRSDRGWAGGGKIVDEFLAFDAETGADIVRAVVTVNTAKANRHGIDYVPKENRVLIGQSRVKGHGVGADNELGAEIAEEDIDEIQGALDSVAVHETDAFLVVAGLGGGTGSGGAPVIAKQLKRIHIEPVYGLGVLPGSDGRGSTRSTPRARSKRSSTRWEISRCSTTTRGAARGSRSGGGRRDRRGTRQAVRRPVQRRGDRRGRRRRGERRRLIRGHQHAQTRRHLFAGLRRGGRRRARPVRVALAATGAGRRRDRRHGGDEPGHQSRAEGDARTPDAARGATGHGARCSSSPARPRTSTGRGSGTAGSGSKSRPDRWRSDGATPRDGARGRWRRSCRSAA